MSGSSNGATRSLTVPIVLWGKQAPSHCVTALLVSSDLHTVVTGSVDGQICLWDVYNDTTLIPRCMLFGHTSKIVCLARASCVHEQPYIVSSTETGEMCVWDTADGRCLESVKTTYIHTSIQCYVLSSTRESRLFCHGCYPEILILDPLTLHIIFSLQSKLNPDWISAICLLKPAKTQKDVCVAMSTSGMVKSWSLTGKECKSGEPYFEFECKQIRVKNAVSLVCCAYNQRVMLIVTSSMWQLFDAQDFSLLCQEQCGSCLDNFSGGEFTSADRVVIWTQTGLAYLYKLPPNAVPGSKEYRSLDAGAAACKARVYCQLSVEGGERLVCAPVMSYHLSCKGGLLDHVLVRADCHARLALWLIPNLSDRDLLAMEQEEFRNPPVLPPSVSLSLQEAWDSVIPTPTSIMDHIFTRSSTEDTGYHSISDAPLSNGVSDEVPVITASIYMPAKGQLAMGTEQGNIIIIDAVSAVMAQLLGRRGAQSNDKVEWYSHTPLHAILHHHQGAVTCLLYPHVESGRYEPNHLLSGATDFTVCLWDLSLPDTPLHTFSVHGGEIQQLLVPPDKSNARVLQCVCSVAADHSVSLLSVKEKKCILLASRHLFPIQMIKWRPLDDFMIVACSDGTVYIWQMETGHLDRVVHGVVAEEMLAHCDDTPGAVDDASAPSLDLMTAMKRRNLAALRHVASQSLLQQAGGMGDGRAMDTAVLASISNQHRSWPLIIERLHFKEQSSDAHMLLFDTEALIGEAGVS